MSVSFCKILTTIVTMLLFASGCTSNYSQEVRPETEAQTAGTVEPGEGTSPDSPAPQSPPSNEDPPAEETTSDLKIMPSSLRFGMIVADNDSSETQSFTLTNAGTASISNIDFQAFTGDTGYFTVVNSGGDCANATLAADATCTFEVKFGPTVAASDEVSATLPIGFTSATAGAAAINLNVKGAARPPLAALVVLESVTSTMPNGSGRAAHLPFQVVSGSATTSTVTLTYRNAGLRAANNFIVDTTTQIPTGYSVQSNTCNGIELKASKANSCVVTLKPAASTAGVLNIEMSSSVLSGSWTDESESVSNRGLVWSTDSGSQDTIYVKVYATHTVTATMSLDSAGTKAASRVKVGDTYYVALESGGDYEEYTTYTITAPSGFSPTTASCKLTSSSRRCYVAITAPSVASTNNTISIVPDDSMAATPSSFTFDVRAKTLYAYLSLGNTGTIRCTVNRDTGSLTCPGPIVRIGGAANHTINMTIDPTKSYLLAQSNETGSPSEYWVCPLDADGNYDDNCTRRDFPSSYNLIFAPTKGQMFAYIAGTGTASPSGSMPNHCSIYDVTSLHCATLPSTSPIYNARDVEGLEIGDKSYVYTIGNNEPIYVSDVTDTLGVVASNTTAAHATHMNPGNSLSALRLGSGDYHMFAALYHDGLYNCPIISTVGATQGRMSDCFRDDDFVYNYSSLTTVGTVNAGSKSFVYLLSHSYEIEICLVYPDGTISDKSNPQALAECERFDINGFSTTYPTNITFGEF